MELSDLEAMVKEVNETQVAPNEVLSDHVYEYDPETKEIFRSDMAAEHQKEKEAAKEKKDVTKERPSLKEKLSEKKKEVASMKKEAKTPEKTKEMSGRG